MLNINPSSKVFICSQLINMHFSFDALCGLITAHFGLNPLSGNIFVFFSKRKDRMKVITWEPDGFAIYYKRLDRGTYSWVLELALSEQGEMQASDFSLILTGINPGKSTQEKFRQQKQNTSKKTASRSLQLV
jgi:transposase